MFGQAYLLEEGIDQRRECRAIQHLGQAVGRRVDGEVTVRDGELAQLVRKKQQQRHREDDRQKHIGQQRAEACSFVVEAEVEGVDIDGRGKKDGRADNGGENNARLTLGRQVELHRCCESFSCRRSSSKLQE